MQLIDGRIKWLKDIMNRKPNEWLFKRQDITLYSWMIDKIISCMIRHAASHSSIHTLKRTNIEKSKQLHVLTDVFMAGYPPTQLANQMYYQLYV